MSLKFNDQVRPGNTSVEISSENPKNRDLSMLVHLLNQYLINSKINDSFSFKEIYRNPLKTSIFLEYFQLAVHEKMIVILWRDWKFIESQHLDTCMEEFWKERMTLIQIARDMMARAYIYRDAWLITNIQDFWGKDIRDDTKEILWSFDLERLIISSKYLSLPQVLALWDKASSVSLGILEYMASISPSNIFRIKKDLSIFFSNRAVFKSWIHWNS